MDIPKMGRFELEMALKHALADVARYTGRVKVLEARVEVAKRALAGNGDKGPDPEPRDASEFFF